MTLSPRPTIEKYSGNIRQIQGKESQRNERKLTVFNSVNRKSWLKPVVKFDIYTIHSIKIKNKTTTKMLNPMFVKKSFLKYFVSKTLVMQLHSLH